MSVCLCVLCVVGWLISADGSRIVEGAAKGGFRIAGEPDREHILPAVCGGPDGVSLVVNSELRGMENIKVVARLVKSP